jgi:hypothetical protein
VVPPELEALVPVLTEKVMREFELVRCVVGKFVQKGPNAALKGLSRMAAGNVRDREILEGVIDKIQMYLGHQDIFRFMSGLTVRELHCAGSLIPLQSTLGWLDMDTFQDEWPGVRVSPSERFELLNREHKGLGLSVDEFRKVAGRIRKPI